MFNSRNLKRLLIPAAGFALLGVGLLASRKRYQKYPKHFSTDSLWQNSKPLKMPAYPGVVYQHTSDVAIVGAGITGLTAALRLQKAGKQTVVVERDTIGSGVTGFNSGHLTSLLLDMKYSTVLSNFGEEATGTIAASLQSSLDYIESQVKEHSIDCDFKRLDGFLYCEKASQVKSLKREMQAVETVGLHHQLISEIPLPFKTKEGIKMEQQGRFNPLQYVEGLAKAFTEAGGRIFEHSPVLDISADSPFVLKTDKGSVEANEVLLATHSPIGLRPATQTRIEALQSYIIGVRVQDVIPDAIFWDMDEPYHYIRLAEDANGTLVIIGGEDHKTGEKRHTEACFQKLEAYARKRFKVTSVDYRWSSELFDPVDGLPYIGKMSGVYIATGYSGEGLTFGTLAGQMIADQILDIPNPCTDILTPVRVKPIASVGGFISENVGTTTHLIFDRMKKPDTQNIDNLLPGEGGLADINGQKTAVYHDQTGHYHFMSPVCTHMGCIVNWNSTEKTWDCPCHGGRFTCDGAVLAGPVTEPLKQQPPSVF